MDGFWEKTLEQADHKPSAGFNHPDKTFVT
jgi:hypothetical protein